MRVTASPVVTGEDECYLVIVEFATGSTGLYQAYVDAESDQHVVVEKRESVLADEALVRSSRR